MNTLSLCVICKNEESNIGTLLESVKGKLFDEIVVVDTGSTDGTLNVLKKYNVKIEHFDWINDFSAARNYAFSKATSTHIMWMDSDDFLKSEDYQKLLNLKSKLHESPIWLLKYEYAHDEKGRSVCSFYRERIVQRSLNLKWEQPIHEYIPLLYPYKQLDIEIQHNRKEVHTSRNIHILEDIVAKNPNFARNVYYLGKEYFDNGEYDKGCPLLLRFIDMPDAWGENKYNAFLKLAEYQINKNNELAKEYLIKAILIDPLKAKAHYHLGDILLGEGKPNEAIHYFNTCTQVGRNDQSLDVIEPMFHTWLPYLQMCLAYNSLGKVYEAALCNEKALAYKPEDQRMINNKKIFMDALRDKYPFQNNESYKIQKELPTFKGKVGWLVGDASFGTTRIRLKNITETLYKLGYDSEYYSSTNKYDIIITSLIFNPQHIEQIKIWKKQGIQVLCDISEDLLSFPYVKETLQECDHVVCSTDAFKESIMSSLGLNAEEISVIPDAVEYFKGGLDDY